MVIPATGVDEGSAGGDSAASEVLSPPFVCLVVVFPDPDSGEEELMPLAVPEEEVPPDVVAWLEWWLLLL